MSGGIDEVACSCADSSDPALFAWAEWESVRRSVESMF